MNGDEVQVLEPEVHTQVLPEITWIVTIGPEPEFEEQPEEGAG